jgi:Tol biopolymer transport system component
VVATRAIGKSTFWRFPIGVHAADESAGSRVSLTTGGGNSPRFGGDSLVYVSSRGGSDSIWKLQGDVATELWNAANTRIVGGLAITRDGRRVAFLSQRDRETSLQVMNADGTDLRVVAASPELHGAPAWTPDEQSITVAWSSHGEPRLVNVPVGGGSPTPLVEEYSVDPSWRPDGELVVYSGPDIGTAFDVKAVGKDGRPSALPDLRLTRGSRRIAFTPDGRSLIVMRGEIGHKNVWLVTLETGAWRPLTSLKPEFGIRDFDISPDGRQLVIEQVQELSNIVLIDLPRR